jgi:hypothetical protein
MAHDEARIREIARSYTDAWCSHDPTKVAEHFVPGGTIAVNGGDPTASAIVHCWPRVLVAGLVGSERLN